MFLFWTLKASHSVFGLDVIKQVGMSRYECVHSVALEFVIPHF